MKKRITALLLCLVMALSLVPTAVWAADLETEGTDEGISVQAITGNWDKTCSSTHGTAYLSTTQTPRNFKFLRDNVASNVTMQVGEAGSYQRLPRFTATCLNCGNTVMECVPDYYATGAGVTLSDPTALKDYGFTLELSDFTGYTSYPCLKFNYTVAKATECKVTLTFYYNYDYPGDSGWCNGCGKQVTVAAERSWYKETATFTINLGVTPTPQQDITLTYDANGGTGAPDPVTKKADANGEAKFDISATVPTRAGYTFLGWADTNNAAAAQYSNPAKTGTSGSLTTSTSKTIYAVWQQKTTPTEPAAPTGDELKEAIGKIQVKDTPKEGITNHGTENFELIDQSYTMTDVVDSKVNVTIMAEKYVAAYNAKHAGHALVKDAAGFVQLTLEKSGDKWSVADGKTPVTFVVECETSNIPNEPTRDDIFNALNGLVTVTCINRVWKDGNKVMDCGEGKYAAKAGIVGQNYTIKQDENNANAWIVTFPVTNFVKAFKQTPAHDLYSNNTLNWSITWTDKKWTAEPVEPGVDDLVKLTHAPTDWREVNKVTHNGIWTSCENGQTGKCEYGIAVAFAKGDVVSVEPQAGVPGSYIATFKVSTYADTCAKACNDKNFMNSSRTHDLLTRETVQWRLYATNQADEKIGDHVLNHVWAATPVTKDKDDVCQVAHRVKVTFDENYNNASTTVMYKYNTNEVKEGRFPTTNPTREGYTFKGWNTKADGNGTAFDAKTVVTADVIVYAKWEPTQYKITYVLNDKDAEHTNQTTYTVEDEFAITDATNGSFGRKFLEWRDADSKTGKAVDKIKKGTTGSITLYAIWQNPVNYYVVDKDGNKTFLQREYVTVHDSCKPIDAPARTGYDFDGWYKSTNDFGVDSKKVENINGTNDKAEWKLYGKLTPNEYAVIFNANGGTTANPETKTVTFDAAYGELATTSRDGYNFLGWYTEKDGGTKVEVDTVVTTAGPHTLYAHWEARSDTPYKVEHYQERLDGTYELVKTENLAGTTDTTVTAVAKSYTGFTYDETVTGTVKSGTIAGNGSLVLKLYYTRNSYTVTFQPNNGKAATTATVKYDNTVAKPTDPTKSGYTFGGWYTDNKCTKGNEFSFDTKITGDITLYAKWDVKRTGTNPDAKNPYIKDNTTKTDGKKVESGKTVKSGDTFDAGISLYVGLGILSLTGSAAAIYKRREEY